MLYGLRLNALFTSISQKLGIWSEIAALFTLRGTVQGLVYVSYRDTGLI